MDYVFGGALLGAVLLLPTAYAGLIGAPWAPTRMPSVKKAFDDIGITHKDLVVDLGAGNAAILVEAERRGAKAVGYELSPIMWLVSYVRSVGKKRISVVYGNFFKKTLPSKTTLVFLFLMPKHMNTVGRYLASQGMNSKTLVLSYAFPFQEVKSLHVYREKKCAPLYLYELSAIRRHFDNAGA